MTQLADIPTRSTREDADDFVGVIVYLSAGWRVAADRPGTQWIVQRRRASPERATGRWENVGYHRHQNTLLIAVARRCGDVPKERRDVLLALPSTIGDPA